MANSYPSEVPGLVTFMVQHNNGRNIWLECYVSVAAQHVLAREDAARHAVRRALDAAAKAFPPEWPRQLCDWTRMERSDSDGHVVVRMPAAMARRILEAQEREALQEAASCSCAPSALLAGR